MKKRDVQIDKDIESLEECLSNLVVARAAIEAVQKMPVKDVQTQQENKKKRGNDTV